VWSFLYDFQEGFWQSWRTEFASEGFKLSKDSQSVFPRDPFRREGSGLVSDVLLFLWRLLTEVGFRWRDIPGSLTFSDFSTSGSPAHIPNFVLGRCLNSGGAAASGALWLY